MQKKVQHKRRGKLPSLEVVDLFCGIGGLSHGMKSKGFKILAGFDIDQTCKYAYQQNNNAIFNFRDIRTVDVTVRRIREKIEKDTSNPKILITKRGVGYYIASK